MKTKHEREFEKYVMLQRGVIAETLASKALSAAEERRKEAMLDAARELGKYFGKDVGDQHVFCYEVVPAAILSTLESCDPYAAHIAAERYLAEWEQRNPDSRRVPITKREEIQDWNESGFGVVYGAVKTYEELLRKRKASGRLKK